MSFRSTLSSGFGAAKTKAKANPIATFIIVVLVLFLLILIILLGVDIATGFLRRRLPGEKCKKDSNCGCGLRCVSNKCVIP